AVQRVSEGRPQKEVADFLGVSSASVSHWVRAYREGGEDGLRAKPPPGRTPSLTDDDLRRLEKQLLQGATAPGWANDLWTCSRVREMIWRSFGVEYHPGYVSVLLRKRLGWTPQRPEQHNANRDEKAIASWVREAFPAIVAAAAARGADVVFVDEAG